MKILKSIWLTVCYPLLYMGAQLVIGGAYTLVTAVSVAIHGVLFDTGAAFDDPYGYSYSNLESFFDLQIPAALSSAIVLLSVYFINRWKWRESGFLRLPAGKGAYLPFGAALGVLASAALNILLTLLDALRFFPDYEEIMDIAMEGSPFFLVISMVILAPLVEEFIFRGLIMEHLRTKMKLPLAILISSAVFGVIHLNLLQGLYAALLGVVMALICVRAGTIWASVCAHAGFNAVSVIGVILMDTPVIAGLALMALYALSIAGVIVFFATARGRKQS